MNHLRPKQNCCTSIHAPHRALMVNSSAAGLISKVSRLGICCAVVGVYLAIRAGCAPAMCYSSLLSLLTQLLLLTRQHSIRVTCALSQLFSCPHCFTVCIVARAVTGSCGCSQAHERAALETRPPQDGGRLIWTETSSRPWHRRRPAAHIAPLLRS